MYGALCRVQHTARQQLVDLLTRQRPAKAAIVASHTLTQVPRACADFVGVKGCIVTKSHTFIQGLTTSQNSFKGCIKTLSKIVSLTALVLRQLIQVAHKACRRLVDCVGDAALAAKGAVACTCKHGCRPEPGSCCGAKVMLLFDVDQASGWQESVRG